MYWPEEHHTSQYGGISVTHLEENIQPSCTKRTFLLSLPQKSDNVSRTSLHVIVLGDRLYVSVLSWGLKMWEILLKKNHFYLSS